MHEAHDWGEQQTAIRRQRQRDIGGLEAKGEQGEVVGWRAKAFEFDTFVEIWACGQDWRGRTGLHGGNRRGGVLWHESHAQLPRRSAVPTPRSAP